MSDEESPAATVVAALKDRGFEYDGRAADGWLKFNGELNAAAERHACELELDPRFGELPRVRLRNVPTTLPRVVPHLGGNGSLCYIAKGTVVLDIFDPVGQTLACVQRAEEVLARVLNGELIGDLEEEFYAYWTGPLCLVDIQGQRLGRQQTLVVEPDDSMVSIVTDDEARTRAKLKALDWVPIDRTVLTFRVRTSARPRPHVSAWPPATVREILNWQGLLDPRCRKKIEKRIKEGMDAGVNGVLVLVESPLLTYGFAVLFGRHRGQKRRVGGARRSMFALNAMPLTVVRIDDRYMASRNVPGIATMAGKRIALIGCGTIGSFLAEMLVKAGAGTSGGQLTLVDFDTLFPQNIGRHRLGFPNLFGNKATELAKELKRVAPGAEIRALPVHVQDAELGPVDLLIDATGEESLGHWLCGRYAAATAMLSVWVEGPGIAVRGLLHTSSAGACYRCLWEANRSGMFPAVVGGTPTLIAGQGCEGLYVPFAASVSVQAASLGAEMALAWANGSDSPSLRTKLVDSSFELATPDCDPPRTDDCPACRF